MNDGNHEFSLRSRKTIRDEYLPSSFSAHLKNIRIFTGTLRNIGREYKVYEIADKLGVERKRLEQIIYKVTPTKSRDCIIAICLVLCATLDDTNDALSLYADFPKLNVDNERDLIIIDLLDNNDGYREDLYEIANSNLKSKGFAELDVPSSRKYKLMQKNQALDYEVLEEGINASISEYYFGRYDDSIGLMYDPDKYSCSGYMWIKYKETGEVYQLIASSSESLVSILDGDVQSLKTFNSLEKTGELKSAFVYLISTVRAELKKLKTILNDTKNYGERIGVDIVNDKIHVFIEQYNLLVPELNEYYLMEYINGKYHLKVSQSSCFMELYLGDLYQKHYKKNSSEVLEEYTSIEQIDALVSNKNLTYDMEVRLKLRKRAFIVLKEKIEDTCTNIKARKVYVRNLNDIWEDSDRVCCFFGVEAEFECKHNEDWGMYFADKENAIFNTPEYGDVEITLDDLKLAFELGYSDINQICASKAKNGSINNIF